ncbi:peptidoglycan-binding protein LysM [Pseudomonas sp. MM211]|uniref:FimV/HubP family polar landmark protein n=1 Tax=Pseudomonas sp. MM211 TaxID=2866808 RepID=UPI001CED6049|nr:FimV/HubP family polar landmark protein [Pseudomonas sp. MM211]UCJ15212.1 peptidoglycan-binding protein LysM [Pseudomonas sp. MM211]
MTRVRHLLIGLASGSAFYSGLAPALGLGEITLHSALNQPLNAEIELLAVGDEMSASDIKVSLAPADAFNLAGVDRVYFLNDLRFSPVMRGGNSVVRVVSNQPVREPYLNFIVELKRPGGQLLREYTVLLDPPTSSSYNSQAAQVGNEQFTSYAPPRRTPIASRGERYQVTSGDSLWTIASKLRVEGNQSSLQDLMLDIHALNPQAFSNGDIHRLRAGVSLLLPDHARMPEAAPSQPAQSGSAPQPEAPAQIIPDTAPQQPAEPQVEVLAQIRRVEEEVANRSAENLQLQQDLLVVQNQLKDMMTRMEARDQQIAQLLEQLAERPAPAAPALPAAETAPSAATQAPAVAPVPAAQPAAEGFWNLWNVLLASLLALLALALLLFKRKRKPDPETIAEPVIVVPPVVQAVAPMAVEPVVATRTAVVDVPLPVRSPVVARTEPNATDPLEGANIYIAYGRLGEAVTALRQASQANPQRLDIRFRLLEVLAQQGNTAAFAEEEAKLRRDGFEDARIDQLKSRYPALFASPPETLESFDSLEPLEGLEELTLELDDLPSSAPEQKKGQDDDFQLNLDDLSLDADWDLVNPFENGARKKRAGVEPTTSEVPSAEQSTDIFGHDASSPFAGTMLVEEEGQEDDWLDLDDLPADEADGLDRFVTNEANLTKLNLAMAYIEQDDLEAACDILNEVLNEGDEEEKQEARELLARIA